MRLIMYANDDNIIRELIKGKDMGIHNRSAVGHRLYHFKVSKKAKIYLESIGGRGFTSKPGNRWIRPDSGNEKSDFVVAKHFLFLWKNRDPVDSRQRFLVMGNCAPGAGTGSQTVLEQLLSDNNNTPIIARAIIGLTDSGDKVWQQYVRTDQTFTKLWVTRHGVFQYIKIVLEEKVSETEVFSAMQNLLEKPEPDLMEDKHWYAMSVEALSLIATERGIAQSHVRNIYMNQIKSREVLAV